VVAGLLLVITSPVLAVGALLVLLTSGRPVLFRQERLGEDGRPFTLVKLRTMRGGGGPGITAAHDCRITGVGAVLRRTSIDELPQLWLVQSGRMTLVGPRPESVELAGRYPSGCRPVLLARPGLTGPAQLEYRERSAVAPPGWDVEQWYLQVVVPLRVASDLAFLARPTLRATLGYVLLTAGFVVGVVDRQRPVSGPRPSGPRSSGPR
jgi:lipopolysaccharide/colanic/teichoic acid biosynthesis glycosyltransferase